ncbi:enoyl-CoA hydratase/isomerase family protein [Herbaspirillum sp. AP02]|uniref:enoyl-CoA hydratase-related protein n=1 Tax=unclassified Herbaspirillum TaxID=2624150 RepID=UPI0015DA3AD1|nr:MULTISPECIES: enoyl-CoA hydratase-related protein [unclassified Herbaspirillum]MBG7620749.1 enoyl-CoA hydratase/isomerase family protein [Herbaspirillum sp. AP02]NZD68212.1 enoyl-CoA hydratase/isomerase family protein [Herbaspirillum sp. AP21]
MAPQPEHEDLLVARHGPHVLHLRLNRPALRNALRNQSLGEIAGELTRAESDDSVRAVVISGNEQAFAAGADLNEMIQKDAIATQLDVRAQYWRTIARFPKPLLAAVNGYALGAGCELLMHADIAIAGRGARIGQPEINVGTLPGAGGTQRLIRTVGKPLAMKMVLSGEFITADQALRAGLVAEVVDDTDTLGRTLALATTIAQKSPLAVRLAKEAMLQSFELGLEAGLLFERKSFSLMAASADRQEGIAAFQQKRAAVFSGR